MIAKFKDDIFLKKLLLIFLVLQPFLDCYLLYTDNVINLFHFSPTTIIRFLIIGFLFLLIFFNRNNKKTRKFVLIYGLLVIIYSITHILLTYDYNTSNFSTFTFSFTAEVFYICRMLLPMAIIYITYTLKPTKEEFLRLFLTVAFIVSLVIVGMNFLNISLTSYGGNNTIKASFFEWFSADRPGSRLLASKGWFNSANQISGLFTLLLPIVIYAVLEKANFKRIIVLSLCILAMLMLGTRVATIGWILILGAMVIAYLFFCLIVKKLKFSKKNFFSLAIVSFVFGILFLYSPLVNIASLAPADPKLEEKEDVELNEKDIEGILAFLAIHEEYYKEIYPIKENKDFWVYVIKDVPYYERWGNRNVQYLITKDIAKRFETPSKQLFGLGYSRFENAKIYVEEDFQVHYYTIGIFGIILFLIPYILIVLYKMYHMFFIDRNSFNFYNAMLLMALVLPICVSLVSGHILDELIITLYMGFIAGYILFSVKKDVVKCK